MSDDSDKKQTEYDLKTAISAAIGKAFPRLNAASIQHQIEFTIRLDAAMARSAFNHSVNYRCAMLVGTAEVVDDIASKRESLRHFVDGYFPGRWDAIRPITEQELKATSVLRMEIDEFSVKSRSGPPVHPGMMKAQRYPSGWVLCHSGWSAVSLYSMNSSLTTLKSQIT